MIKIFAQSYSQDRDQIREILEKKYGGVPDDVRFSKESLGLDKLSIRDSEETVLIISSTYYDSGCVRDYEVKEIKTIFPRVIILFYSSLIKEAPDNADGLVDKRAYHGPERVCSLLRASEDKFSSIQALKTALPNCFS